MRPPAGMKFERVPSVDPDTVKWKVTVELVVHHCPPIGSGLTSCCERTPFELPSWDRLTEDAALVTCRGRSA